MDHSRYEGLPGNNYPLKTGRTLVLAIRRFLTRDQFARVPVGTESLRSKNLTLHRSPQWKTPVASNNTLLSIQKYSRRTVRRQERTALTPLYQRRLHMDGQLRTVRPVEPGRYFLFGAGLGGSRKMPLADGHIQENDANAVITHAADTCFSLYGR